MKASTSDDPFRMESLLHIKCFRVQNFRRLKDAFVDFDQERTIFVGANNSGKTSATHLFQLFLSQQPRAAFQIYDFTADCWEAFNSFDPAGGDPDAELPQITFDLWFDVKDDDLHRVLDLLPGLDWEGEPVGVRMVYAPRDGRTLLDNFADARSKAEQTTSGADTSYRAWPQSMVDYLTKRLQQEYEIKYFALDARQCDAQFTPKDEYQPFFLGTHLSGASRVLDSVVRVDFLHAQRHLSDSDSHGRSEDLSKRLSRFYERNLQKLENDLGALGAITEAEDRLNDHFADVFGSTLHRLAEVGYPGVANPGLVVKASFNAHSILSTSTKVHYALPAPSDEGMSAEHMLPDQYNGLGFKNLIYMVVELLDFHHAWAEVEHDRPPIHLVMIEEPEAHLHAQLQQVFIRKVLEVLPEPDSGFKTQLVVTTHSPHIIYESNFTPIRYFSRAVAASGLHCSDVKNLSSFYDNEEGPTRDFLQQYIKLTHCDLFFADAAVLVEGNVERLLLPLVIERFVPDLRSCHLTILEVGGAFAYKFEKLVKFLDMPTLVITDLDSVAIADDADDDADDADERRAASCPVDTPGAVTSNQTLRQWIPGVNGIQELLAADDELRSPADDYGNPGSVRVAYQSLETVSWQGHTDNRAGRTLEEAFALQNLEWTQSAEGRGLGLRIRDAPSLEIKNLHDALFKRIKSSSFDKTAFALGVIAAAEQEWKAPAYMVDGLTWLQDRLAPVVAEGPIDPPTPDPESA